MCLQVEVATVFEKERGAAAAAVPKATIRLVACGGRRNRSFRHGGGSSRMRVRAVAHIRSAPHGCRAARHSHRSYLACILQSVHAPALSLPSSSNSAICIHKVIDYLFLCLTRCSAVRCIPFYIEFESWTRYLTPSCSPHRVNHGGNITISAIPPNASKYWRSLGNVHLACEE